VHRSTRRKGKPTPDLKAVRDILNRHSGEAGAVIPVLEDLQRAFGYLPRQALRLAARRLGRPLAEVMGVATFYAQFRFAPGGRHTVRLCHGTACHVAGAERISWAAREELGVGEGETTADRAFTLTHVACLGCCSLAPVMMVDETAYGRLTPETVRRVFARYRRGTER
jgi:NADH-quinone oxidoreductase subunit E